MTEAEQIEKIRQAVMRYRELMDIVHERVQAGERTYEGLFRALSPEQMALPEKLRQREAAIVLLEDMERLRRAVLRMSLGLQEMGREFEELYGHIAEEV